MFYLISFALLALGADDPADPGRYGVGSTTWVIEDPSRERTLVTEIWYPTSETNGTLADTYSSGAISLAFRDVKVAPGPFPLVIFSHGLASVREQSTFLTEHLASHGYIVAAPDHQHNTGRDLRPFGVLKSAQDRPVDVGMVINHVLLNNQLPGDPFYSRIDAGRIAVIGHSLGGSTALATAGAWVDAHALQNGGRIDYLNFTDPRVRAAIAYMPVYQPYFDEFGLRQLEKPVLIVAGELDTVTQYEKSQLPLYRALRAPRVLALIEGASHFNLVNEEVIEGATLLVRTMHKPTINRDTSNAEVKRLTLAFLESRLSGNDGFLKWMTQSRKDVLIQSILQPTNIGTSNLNCPPSTGR